MTQAYDQLKNQMTREAARADNQLAQPRWAKVESYDPKTHRVVCSLEPERTDDGEKILTPWLHILTPMCGPSWGIVSPLEQGDQVVMLPMYNSGTEFVVIGAAFSQPRPPAQGENDIGGEDQTTTIGQYLLRSKSGMTMKFVDDKTLVLKGTYEKHDVTHIITKGTDVKVTASDFVDIDCKNCHVTASESIVGKAGQNITGQAGSKITLTAPEVEINGHVTINGDTNENGSFVATGNVADYGSTMGYIREIYDVHTHDDSGPPEPQMPD